jgi:hypothetical protein
MSTTLSFLSSRRSRGICSFTLIAAEAEEENCRSLGFARDDKKERAVEKSGVVKRGASGLEMEF